MKKSKEQSDKRTISSKELSFIIGGFRKAFRISELRKQCLAATRKRVKTGPKRERWEFRCASCQEWFPQNLIAVDHISPMIPLDKTAAEMSFDEIFERLYCEPGNLQCLCQPCHKRKTADERRAKAAARKVSKAGRDRQGTKTRTNRRSKVAK